MDDTRLPELQRVARRVVREAQKPGGLLEKVGFTMGVARRQIAQRMGFEDGELEDKEWKKHVKEAVMKYLDGDEDEGNEQPEAGPSRSPSPAVANKKNKETEQPKKKQSRPIVSDEERAKAASPLTKAHMMSNEADEAGVESDMSSVYDVPPPKRRKKSSSGGSGKKDEDDGKVAAKKRKKKDPDEDLSPDEAKVAELKRIVVACGVRKQWSKEFADYSTPSAQIRHLHSLLSELGMKGNPTMGKARSLKEKRELAAELDDVREFEATRGMSGTEDRRASRSKASKRSSRSVDVDDDVDVSPGPEQVPGQKSALDSVLDFLGDQSD